MVHPTSQREWFKVFAVTVLTIRFAYLISNPTISKFTLSSAQWLAPASKSTKNSLLTVLNSILHLKALKRLSISPMTTQVCALIRTISCKVLQGLQRSMELNHVLQSAQLNMTWHILKMLPNHGLKSDKRPSRKLSRTSMDLLCWTLILFLVMNLPTCSTTWLNVLTNPAFLMPSSQNRLNPNPSILTISPMLLLIYLLNQFMDSSYCKVTKWFHWLRWSNWLKRLVVKMQAQLKQRFSTIHLFFGMNSGVDLQLIKI